MEDGVSRFGAVPGAQGQAGSTGVRGKAGCALHMGSWPLCLAPFTFPPHLLLFLYFLSWLHGSDIHRVVGARNFVTPVSFSLQYLTSHLTLNASALLFPPFPFFQTLPALA